MFVSYRIYGIIQFNTIKINYLRHTYQLQQARCTIIIYINSFMLKML